MDAHMDPPVDYLAPHLPDVAHGLLHAGWATTATACAAALALTVVLAARLTPRHWWRRPTLRGGAVLAAGTLAFGTLFLVLFLRLAGAPRPALALTGPAAPPATASVPTLAGANPPDAAPAPAPGVRYRVVEQLNLRAKRGVHAARLAVLPAGSRVVASGAFDGDWWQVRARVDGRSVTGWTSSLWLRRGDEP